MNKFLSILLAGIFFVSCTSNTIIEKPKNLIPKEQMIDLLTDLLLANGSGSIKNTQLKRNVNYYPLVFEKYNIDTVQFRESNYYYATKVDEYDEIIRKVEARLEALLKQFEDERKLKDSLTNFKNTREDMEIGADDAYVQ
jgi:hypothetical protein